MSEVADLRRRLREYETVLEVGAELASTLELPRVLEMALWKAEELCRAESSSIWERDDERDELFFRVVRGRLAGDIEGLRVPMGEGIVGSVARSQRAEVVNEPASDPRWKGEPVPGFTTRALLTVPLVSRGRTVGVLQLLNPLDQRGFSDRDRRRMELFAGPLAHAVANARLYLSQKRLFFDTVTALAEAIEKRDPYTGGHVRRVVAYSLLLARELGVEGDELEDLALAATLHDVGKIGLPDEVLGKPERLDAEETAIMQRHPVDGAEIVARIRSLRHLLPAIRHHHERMDGTGYPEGLAGDELPEPARIIAVADTFDAMTTHRPYREAMAAEAAAEEIARHAGDQFCPRVAGAFGRLFDRGELSLERGERLLAALSEGLEAQ